MAEVRVYVRGRPRRDVRVRRRLIRAESGDDLARPCGVGQLAGHPRRHRIADGVTVVSLIRFMPSRSISASTDR